MQPNNRHSIIRLTLLVLVFVGAVTVLFNRQFVIDQLRVWQYTPPANVEAISRRVQFTDRGKFLFYTAVPSVDDKKAFNNHCRQLVEKTAILGCYTNQNIYIYNVTDARLDGIKEVTAAHEMLHVAYDRLSQAEKSRVDRLIEQQATSLTDQKLLDRLALYDKTEPGERLNELHSILGSEISTLSPELEAYYRQYFVNRTALVALSNAYEKVFNQVEEQQKTLIQELNALAETITTLSDEYTKAVATLRVDIDNFNQRAAAGSFSSQQAFNAERKQLLVQQESLQAKHDTINTMIAQYNRKKTQLDTLNSTAEGLHKSIDSTAPVEVPTL